MHLIFFREIFQMAEFFKNSFRGLLTKFISRTSDFTDFYFIKIHSTDLGFHGLFLRSAMSLGSVEFTWPNFIEYLSKGSQKS